MSLRTALDSGWLYFAGAAVLLLAAALSLVQYNPQTERPVGSLAELSQLADRDDLNVVLSNWNNGTPPSTSALNIPEPGTCLVMLVLLSCVRRRG